MAYRTHLVLVTLFALLALVGCRQAQNTLSPEAANIALSLSLAPNPPAVGPATLVVTLADSSGGPINDAQVAVRGDMDHAGMQPVLAQASVATDGDYTLPFEWTMGGDWFLDITITLADGRVITEQFDFTVDGDIAEMDDMDATEESSS